MSATAGQNFSAWLRHPVVQVLILALATWGVLRFLVGILGFYGVLLVVIIAGLAALVNWMLRYRQSQLAVAYAYPGAKHFIDFVCQATGLQPPTSDASPETPQDEMAVKDAAEFGALFRRMQEKVRGHDQPVQQTIEQLKAASLLRSQNRQKSDLPPLATFLFAGSPGIGKRHLARLLGRSIYKKAAVLELDLASEVASPSLGSASGFEATIIEAVKARPYHALILDNIEQATPALARLLRDILAYGTTIDPATGSRVSFEHCVIFLIASRGADALHVAREQATGKRDWNQRAHEVLARESPLDVNLLAHVDEVLLFSIPSKLQKAEVILLLIERECRKYNVRLDGIDPQLLADEVAAVTDDRGFEISPARVERLLRDPLHRAARTKSPSVVLRQHEITMVSIPEYHDT